VGLGIWRRRDEFGRCLPQTEWIAGLSATRAFPANTESPSMLYLFVFTQFRTQNRFALLLELL
jgi:hypothetical protein